MVVSLSRRDFLRRTTRTIVGGVVLVHVGGKLTAIEAAEQWHNWAGNKTSHAEGFHEPTNVDQVVEIVKSAKEAHAVGSGHSFGDISQTRGQLASFAKMNRFVSHDPKTGLVTVEAGMKYGELAEHLKPLGRAVHNLASLPHISVKGSVATGSHGSGDQNPNLAHSVVALKMVIASGKVETLSRDTLGDRFDGVVVSLGCLGMVTEVTLQTLPAFNVRQFVYEGVPFASFLDNFDEAMRTPYSGSFFTNYADDAANELWWKLRVNNDEKFEPAAEFHGGKLAQKDLHPIISYDPENCTEQMGVPGLWSDRLPHFVMGFRPSTGKELHTEYFVPRERAVEVLNAVRAIRAVFAPCLFVSEVRTVAPDQMWMSPAYGRKTVAVHFTWKYDGPQNLDMLVGVLPKLDAVFAKFDGRPHWGKLFDTNSARLQALYPKIGDFRKLIDHFDPDRKFGNSFLRKWVYEAA